jgi:predicted metalloenzyme YecM
MSSSFQVWYSFLKLYLSNNGVDVQLSEHRGRLRRLYNGNMTVKDVGINIRRNVRLYNRPF